MNLAASINVLLGYDGSATAGSAIEAAAELFPGAHAWIAHLWTPPFASEPLRRRLWHGSASLDDFVAAIEREGAAESARLAATGVVLARAAGWEAEPVTQRSYGGEGLEFGTLAQKLDADVVVVGSRGLEGARALLGSVSDLVVHYTHRPVLVVPAPLLTAERATLGAGPVMVGWDGSPGARRAFDTAGRLFPDREIKLAVVHDGTVPGAVPPDHDYVTRDVGAHHADSARAVAEALTHLAGDHGAAVTVVGSRGRSALREILLGSVAMATVHHSPRPVLVVPSGAPASAG